MFLKRGLVTEYLGTGLNVADERPRLGRLKGPREGRSGRMQPFESLSEHSVSSSDALRVVPH